jgi:undecaprenyl-diphosphatase
VSTEVAPPEAPVYAPAIKLGPVSTVDRWVDESVAAHLRGRAAADRVFYAASALGDHGIIWLILAVLRGLRADGSWRATVRAAAAVGIESLLVNGPVKWVFRRQRPPPGNSRPHPLRAPRTSSFPSGHATAAFFGAALLREDDPVWPLYYALAVIVAASRVHVRIHHASDVIGGVVTGIALGELVRRLVPLDPQPMDQDGPVPTGDGKCGMTGSEAALNVP